MLSLIKVRAGGMFSFENIPSYLKYFYPHLAQIVMISPLLDREAFSASGEIARSGYELLVLSPNPVDYTSVTKSRREKDNRALRIARELALMVRSSNLTDLREAGALVLDWRKGEPLDFTLAKNMRVHARQAELEEGDRVQLSEEPRPLETGEVHLLHIDSGNDARFFAVFSFILLAVYPLCPD